MDIQPECPAISAPLSQATSVPLISPPQTQGLLEGDGCLCLWPREEKINKSHVGMGPPETGLEDAGLWLREE